MPTAFPGVERRDDRLCLILKREEHTKDEVLTHTVLFKRKKKPFHEFYPSIVDAYPNKTVITTKSAL